MTQRWINLNSTEDPGTRESHTCVAYKEFIYIFGGVRINSSFALDDMWQYNTLTNTWRKIPVNMKAKRMHSAVTFWDGMFIFGGYDNLERSKELVRFDFITEEATQQESAEQARSSHSAVTYNNSMIVYGGSDGEPRGDTLVYNFLSQKWTEAKCTGTIPKARHGHTSIVHKRFMYVFGGYVSYNTPASNDLYALDLETFHWTLVQYAGDIPERRAFHTAVYKDKTMVVYAGYGEDGVSKLDDLWELNLSNMKGTKKNLPNAPKKRTRHTAAICGNKMIVFAGADCWGVQHGDVHALEFPWSGYATKLKRSLKPRSAMFDDVIFVN